MIKVAALLLGNTSQADLVDYLTAGSEEKQHQIQIFTCPEKVYPFVRTETVNHRSPNLVVLASNSACDLKTLSLVMGCLRLDPVTAKIRTVITLPDSLSEEQESKEEGADDYQDIAWLKERI